MNKYKHSQFNAGWWSCLCSIAQRDQRLSGMSAYLMEVMRDAYARLIDAISGKGTWYSNPYVFAYNFELVR